MVTRSHINLLTIFKKVQHEKSRLEAVSSRLDVAKQKVTKVAGSTKATVVHSSAKYPAPNFLEDYTPLYADMLAASAKHSHYHLSATPHVRIMQPRVILSFFFSVAWAVNFRKGSPSR